MAFAGGKIVVTLEGGYSLEALSMSVCMSVEALLQGVPDEELTEDDASMKSSTWPLIERVKYFLIHLRSILLSPVLFFCILIFLVADSNVRNSGLFRV